MFDPAFWRALVPSLVPFAVGVVEVAAGVAVLRTWDDSQWAGWVALFVGVVTLLWAVTIFVLTWHASKLD